MYGILRRFRLAHYRGQVPTTRLFDALPDQLTPPPVATATDLLAEVRGLLEEIRTRASSALQPKPAPIRVNKSTMDRATRCPRSVGAMLEPAEPQAVLLGNLIDIAHQVRARGISITQLRVEDWSALTHLADSQLGEAFDTRIEAEPQWWETASAHIASLDAMLPENRKWITEVPVQASLLPDVVASLRLDGFITREGVGCVLEVKTERSQAEASLRDRVMDLYVGALLASVVYDIPVGAAALLVTHTGNIEVHSIDEASLSIAAQRLADTATIVLQVLHTDSLLSIRATSGSHCHWCPLATSGCPEALI